ncbi:hypothetical protein K227x_00830 [Rubripirellula lacrimiformis]|uniref:Uncharacterized protein n=1 Tax=Rubripirellula lacrimiformis TaxID=1930273 RepID=A0A517N3K9_9BACT|nr:hypothetical protein [Rubripirellula lacrimiformis]QDT01716.1 hypothetical protein K227x_00830 [Rubripirellula lacrimiformis]
MTTSSDHNTTPSKPVPSGQHWNELTATLTRESTEAFALWMDEDLDKLTEELKRYASPRSVLKSISR